MEMDLTIKISGEAGQGLQTIGQLLAQVFARKGLHVFANQVLQSRIRGGHNSFQVRVSDTKVLAPHPTTNILIALDKESSAHFDELTKNSITIFDGGTLPVSVPRGVACDVPLARIASESGGNKLMANTVAVAAVLGLLGCGTDILFGLLRESFGGKNKELAELNVKIAQAGYDFTIKNFSGNVRAHLEGMQGQAKMLIGGSESVALGALAAGCQFISAYPMSPSTGIMTYLASKADDFHVVVEQSEDEIASINIALGASFAGVRAMTASSGGGFALMAEGLSLAGMLETPIVVVLAQRPAPATGLPTRTAQEDLNFALYAGHGEVPRFLIAPATIEDAFTAMPRAFNLSDKYRVPVIVLTDQFLMDSLVTVQDFNLEGVKIERYLMSEDELKAAAGDYKSYLLTKNGISPRALPGNPHCFVTADSDEHDETGRITEDLDFMRPRMVLKRNKKIVPMTNETLPPRFYGIAGARDILVGWGSTYGALREAVDLINGTGGKAALVHFQDVWPLNEKHLAFVKKARSVTVVENNFTGQFARLLTTVTGVRGFRTINKFNGLAFDAAEIVKATRAHKKEK